MTVALAVLRDLSNSLRVRFHRAALLNHLWSATSAGFEVETRSGLPGVRVCLRE
jgi:hypothetical protein